MTISLAKFNDGLTYYAVEQVGDNVPVLCEDGDYHSNRGGYAVVNKETGVREHTTLLLPGALFQAQHLDSTLGALLANDTPDLADMPVEDVTVN